MENNSNAREYRVRCPDSRSSALMPLIALLLQLGRWQRFLFYLALLLGYFLIGYRNRVSLQFDIRYLSNGGTYLARWVSTLLIFA